VVEGEFGLASTDPNQPKTPSNLIHTNTMATDEKLEAEDIRKRLLAQSNARVTIRNSRLRVMSVLYTVIFVAIAILQTVSIAFFTKGFLLSRQVLDNYSSTTDIIFQDASSLRNFDKAVIVIIDALRFDFVIPDELSDKPYHNHLKLPYEMTQMFPENSVLLKFMADPPTTTLQRLKGLTTGSLPTFVDAGSNFDGDVIEEDNFIKQLYQNNRSITFVGDDTWQALFSPFFNVSYPYDSLNVWDLHTVDNGVIDHFGPLLEKKRQQDWDILIGHLLGMDHCGHRYGPDHYAMIDKQEQMDGFLRNITQQLDDDTLLIVMGDHGMDRTGNHGGDSQDELEAALWLYSKKRAFKQLSNEVYNISKNGQNHRKVNQIDLVPTFSLLMGLPLPFNNLGAPIQEAFQDTKYYKEAAKYTMEQIHRYRQHSKSLKDDILINSKYEEAKSAFHHPDFTQKFEDYQNISLERCKDLWARFDMISIVIGILLMLFSIIILIVYSKMIPSVVISQLSEEIVPSIIAMVSLFSVIAIAISLILKPSFMSLMWCTLFGVAVGIVFGFSVPIFDRYNLSWLFYSFLDRFGGFWTLVALLFSFFHVAIFASNSFTIWEDRILGYLLTTFGLLCAFKSIEATKKFDRVMGIYHSLSFMVLTRLASLITICREEQGTLCTPNYHMSLWTIGALFIQSQVFPVIIKAFYNLSGSYQTAAPLWNNMFKLILLMISLYWGLEWFERNQSDLEYDSLKKISLSSVHFVKYTLARIIAGVTLIAANYGWSRGPLCVKLNITHTETTTRESAVLGYQNVYGSQYFLLVMNIITAVMLFMKPMGQFAIFLMVYQILALVELTSILDIRSNLISPVIFGILGWFYFFSTGHQATIPSIQWEIGFTLVDSIVFPLTHIPIFLNTFGSFLIIGVSIALVTFWKISPSFKPISLYSKIIENCGTLLAYQSVVTLSSLIFAAVFRRHLMVWKIFAPRFMIAALVQLTIDAVLVLLTIGFASGRLIIQINRIFGK
jgi:phosphatidylinositol glycan class O